MMVCCCCKSRQSELTVHVRSRFSTQRPGSRHLAGGCVARQSLSYAQCADESPRHTPNSDDASLVAPDQDGRRKHVNAAVLVRMPHCSSSRQGRVASRSHTPSTRGGPNSQVPLSSSGLSSRRRCCCCAISFCCDCCCCCCCCWCWCSRQSASEEHGRSGGGTTEQMPDPTHGPTLARTPVASSTHSPSLWHAMTGFHLHVPFLLFAPS
jgi:hypothetical protein